MTMTAREIKEHVRKMWNGLRLHEKDLTVENYTPENYAWYKAGQFRAIDNLKRQIEKDDTRD